MKTAISNVKEKFDELFTLGFFVLLYGSLTVVAVCNFVVQHSMRIPAKIGQR